MADPLLDLLNGGAQAPAMLGSPASAPASSSGGDPLLQLIGGSPQASGAPMQQSTQQPMQVGSPVGGFLNNAAAGAGKFVSDTAMGSKQLLTDLAASAQDTLKNTAFGRGADWLDAKLGLQSPQLTQQQGRQDILETRRLDQPLMDTGAGKLGYAAGALSLLPVTPATSGYGGAAMIGSAMGATQPAASWAERGLNTALGAGSGAAGQAVANGISRVIQPQTPQAARDLIDAGVTLTPGQILGGGFKRAEEGATSIPIVGDFIKGAQNRQIAQLNDAVANRALAPINDSLPAGVSGREAVDYVGSALGARYDELLPKLIARADAPFVQDVKNLHQMVNNGAMGAPEVQQFNKILQNNILSRFQGPGAVTGDTVKSIDSDLGRLASNYSRDPSADKRQLGDAIGELQNSLRSLLTRSNPQYATQLNDINSGWAMFKRLQRASSSVAADDGVFNPAQLQGAVKALDRSKDKGAFARGDALLQDLSDPAKQLLAPKLNDSGTPYRSLLMAGAAGAAGHFVSPWAIAPTLAAPAMYSPAGQRLLQGLLTSRPGFAAPAAQMAGLLGTPLSLMAPALTYASRQ